MASRTTRVAPDYWGRVSIVVAVLSLAVFLPEGFGRWFLPKEVVLLGAVLLVSLAAPAGRLPRFLWALIAAGALILLVAALTGDAPLAQLFGRWPRYEGLVSVPVYVAAGWLGARALGPAAPVQRIRAFYRSLSVVSLLIAVVGVAEAFGARPIASDLDRPGSLLGNATDQGLVGAALAALLVLPLLRALDGRGRVEVRQTAAQWGLLAAGMLAAIATVVVSASRAGALALVVAFAILAGLFLWEARRLDGPRALVRRAIVVAGAAAVVAGALLALPFTRDRLLGSSNFAASSVGDRFLIWGETASLLGRNPLTGVGPSGFVDAIAPEHGAEWYARVGTGTVLDSPHSWPLQAAMAGGLPLLALALLFCGYLVLRVWRGRVSTGASAAIRADARRDLVVGSFVALVALGAGLATHFTGAATGILIGLLVGVVVAVAPGDEHPLRRPVRSAVVAIWLVLLVLATAAEVPLQRALSVPDARQSDALFGQASALRPWDADLSSIAAQSLAQRADSGDPTAAPLAIAWAQRSLATVPSSVTTRSALGVAQRAVGDTAESAATLGGIAAEMPLDATAAFQHGLSLAADGQLDAARLELERADELRPGDASIEATLERLISMQ